MSAYTSIEDPREARAVDFIMEIGMSASNAFWNHATVDDVTGGMESCEEAWPLTKLIELRDALQDMILNTAAPGRNPKLFLTNQS
jgi:hypothetical protein